MPRFQGFSNSEDSFVNYSGIFEVTGVIITPVLHILTFQKGSFFLVEKHLQPHQCRSKDNGGKEFYTFAIYLVREILFSSGKSQGMPLIPVATMDEK